MKFYKQSKGDKLICTLCQHYCNIDVGKTGICGVNKNTGERIECLVYGYPAVINIDPVEKKPLYHFLPQTKTLSLGTVGCNFKCSFCQNHGISQEHTINKEKYYSPQDIVLIALNNRCESISYTYNEPTIFYPYIRDIATIAHQNGLKNIFVTNGFESIEVLNDMKGLIDGANVDLKSFDSKYYKKELGGDLEKLKNNLKLFKQLGIWIEVTTLIIPTINDSDEELRKIATFINDELGNTTPWHLSAFHPDYKLLDIPRTSTDLLQTAYNIGKTAGLSYVYMGNAGLPNETCCRSCGEVLLERITYKTTKNNLSNGVSCKKCTSLLDGVFHTKRDMGFAGSFYSKNCDEIKKQFAHFDLMLKNSDFKPPINILPKAIIVPHAGYIYSGFSANVAYSLVTNPKTKRVLLIGPSHRVAFNGASLAMFDRYSTVCGEIKIDLDYGKKLLNNFPFINFNKDAHLEHSTETQSLFIKRTFPNAKIVEIVYGRIEHQELAKVIDFALNDNETFVVISTDLSHFYDKAKAMRLDSICLEAVAKLDLDIWNKGCEACGRVGVKALIEVVLNKGFKSRLLDYRTSADATKDDSRVVGYLSAIIYQNM